MFLPVCECGNVPLARGLIVRGFTVPSRSRSCSQRRSSTRSSSSRRIRRSAGTAGSSCPARRRVPAREPLGWLFSKHPEVPARCSRRASRPLRMTEQHGHEHRKVERSLQQFVAGSARDHAGAASSVRPWPRPRAGPRPAGRPCHARGEPGVVGARDDGARRDVSVCSNVDAFFVLSFGSTFLPGSIVAFLVFGPVSTSRCSHSCAPPTRPGPS